MSYAFGGIETTKILFVCCSGDCRRDEIAKLINTIQDKGNDVARTSQFVMGEFVNFRKSRIEVKRNYFAVQETLESDVRGRSYDKVETCKCIELTQRQEATIAMHLK